MSVVVYKVLHGCETSYLGPFTYVADLPSRRGLRSCCSDCLVQPLVHRSTVGSRAFSVAGPQVWNCLPATGGHVGTVSGDIPHSTQEVCFLSHILTFGSTDIFVSIHTVYSGASSVCNTLTTLQIHLFIHLLTDWSNNSGTESFHFKRESQWRVVPAPVGDARRTVLFGDIGCWNSACVWPVIRCDSINPRKCRFHVAAIGRRFTAKNDWRANCVYSGSRCDRRAFQKECGYNCKPVAFSL